TPPRRSGHRPVPARQPRAPRCCRSDRSETAQPARGILHPDEPRSLARRRAGLPGPHLPFEPDTGRAADADSGSSRMNLAREKTAVFATLGELTKVLYFGTLHNQLFAARVLAPTAVDTAIPFVPLFVIPYLSFFPLVLLPLLLISDRRELRDAAFGYGLIVAISSLMFLFWPTAIPYSDVHPLTRGVVAVDLDGNAFPSLHASLGIYCALWAWRKLPTPAARYGLFAWTSLVVVSALLIKRHLAVDIAGGVLLGWATAATLFRPDPAEAPDTEPVVETLRIRKKLARESSREFAALTRHDGRKRAGELAVFIALASTGLWVSVHARSVASAPL